MLEKLTDLDLDKVVGGASNKSTHNLLKCNDCNITFDTETDYNIHMRKVHDISKESKRGEM